MPNYRVMLDVNNHVKPWYIYLKTEKSLDCEMGDEWILHVLVDFKLESKIFGINQI